MALVYIRLMLELALLQAAFSCPLVYESVGRQSLGMSEGEISATSDWRVDTPKDISLEPQEAENVMAKSTAIQEGQELAAGKSGVHVAFSAYLSQNLVGLKVGEAVVFDRVLINDEERYDANTGIYMFCAKKELVQFRNCPAQSRNSHFVGHSKNPYIAQCDSGIVRAQSRNRDRVGIILQMRKESRIKIGGQSKNSYFAQDNSGIVPILTLRRTYTIPVDGVYSFSYYIGSRGPNEAFVTLDGIEMSEAAVSTSSDAYHGQGGKTSIFHATKGQKVEVRQRGGSGKIEGFETYRITTFSGTLLYVR